MARRWLHPLRLSLLTLATSHCNKAKFAGNNDHGASDQPTATPAGAVKEIDLTCEQQSDPSKNSIDLHAAAGQALQVTLKGDVCLTAQNNLTVVFMVDWSGSMQQNDPTSAGSCGRSQAAKAILDSLKSQPVSSGVQIKVGLIPFSSSVDPATVIPLTDFAAFYGQVNAANFCQEEDTTNYLAAFNQGTQMLSSVAGRKVIYFISDGVPNVGAAAHASAATAIQDSVNAGKQMQSSVADLTINSLLLGSEGPAAMGVMTQIAGTTDRVRVVADASSLATAILNFPPPSIAAATVKGSLSTPDTAANPTPVIVSDLTADPTRALVWTYSTNPMTLTSKAQATVVNTFTAKVDGADGKTMTVRLNVSQD